MSSEPEIVKSISISGFDPLGEPELRHMSDSSILVVFNFMPPSWAEEDQGDMGAFEDFDKQLERAISVPVHWEDREFFLIRNPNEDTSEKIKQFLQAYGT